ncbi:MAG TPA: ATPase domain-containing protein [Nitrososphaeraceae archaeon]|nr:ATPase domain-containing protein [Nitrososphaeraceae archaeon]
MAIPGLAELTDGDEHISPTLFLLSGPPGIGKRDYCREFLEEGLVNQKRCILISSKITDKDKIELLNSKDTKFKPLFVNPVLLYDTPDEKSLQETLTKITSYLSDIPTAKSQDMNVSKSGSPIEDDGDFIYFVMDSLNYFCDIYEVSSIKKFLARLVLQLKKSKTIGIFTIDSPVSTEYQSIISFCDGIVEMKFEESNDTLIRKIRLLSMAGHAMTKPTWIQFSIDKNGRFTFADDLLKCTLDGRVIQHVPVYYLDLPFHSEDCAITYRKFMSVFKDLDPKYEVLNYNFCFIDIVGLSNPELAVHRQKEKIVRLNEFISSCNSFRKISDDLKIILPAGDGMAIGYENNPELPYKLSVELHGFLRKYNKRIAHDKQIKVRIGLSSGPVFTVYDISNRLNVWGPGIIMARRVMDLGDSWHILIAENFAMQLKPLYEEYRNNIRLIGSYEIKHGEKIKVYSAYSNDYGNPELPEKFKKIDISQ